MGELCNTELEKYYYYDNQEREMYTCSLDQPWISDTEVTYDYVCNELVYTHT